MSMSSISEHGNQQDRPIVGTVVELFAGVGGFRLGLEGRPGGWRRPGDFVGRWQVIWANQWEPSMKAQDAFECYARRFRSGVHTNVDIACVDSSEIPDHDLLVGGFPCQDYSVAKPLNQAHGIEGKKGVLWWEIHRIVEAKRPPLLLLENVDRLLKSPGSQRGRDFGIILGTLASLGYLVEWRVVNAADYGFPQRRRRVFLVGRRMDTRAHPQGFDGYEWIVSRGVLARALPCSSVNGRGSRVADLVIPSDPYEISTTFGVGCGVGPFKNAGVMCGHKVWTQDVAPVSDAPRATLGDVLQPDADVPEEFFIPESKLGDPDDPAPGTWRYLKGSKRELRRHRSGAEYVYTEGALPFPDPLDRPARTILTGEGGSAPSRFKHVVATTDGRYRRLTPVELERLNGFPDGWTEGMSPNRRAFCMGNALVVGIVERIGDVLAADLSAMKEKGALSVG